MTVATLILRRGVQPRITEREAVRRIPIEGPLIFVSVTALYIAVSVFLVFRMHYMIDDAYARIDNAFDVLFTSDPHLAAIGFFWPPLPSFLELPIIAFKDLWPPLVTQGFAGCIEASLFGAGTVVLLNSGCRWAGVVRPIRWLICLAWVANPMTIIYSTQGMSEAPFMFFFFASILVFLRWSESYRMSLLPLLGVLAGLGCLCRNESFFVAALLAIGVVAVAIRRRESRGGVENAALLYVLPALFMVMLWLGTAAVIFHDPLYWLHANGISFLSSNSATADVANAAAAGSGVSRAEAFGVVSEKGFGSAAAFVLGHSLTLYPGVIALLAVVAVPLVTRGNRVGRLMVVLLGAAIPLMDMMIIQSGLGPYLRYQIQVIPFTFLLAVVLLRSVRSKRKVVSSLVAIAIVAVLSVSNLQTAQTLSNPSLGLQEAPLLTALAQGKSVPEATGIRNKIDIGAEITPQVLALDRDRGRILCDSTTCFPIILNAPDPTLFRVTSDRTFEASAAAPLDYGIEYFLVPALRGQGAFERLNVLYPTLWRDGAGFATLVGVVDGDPMGQWRLYRITSAPNPS